MSDVARLLGFAFANADLLIEVDRKGKITFASGAVEPFAGNGELVGGNVVHLFAPAAGVKFMTYVRAVSDGGREGPLVLTLAKGGEASASFCNLPQNGDRICCTLSLPGSRQSIEIGIDKETGLSDSDTFLATAAAMAGEGDRMTLVDLPALSESSGAGNAAELFRTVGEAMKSSGAEIVGRVGKSTFGAIGAGNGVRLDLANTIRKSLQKGGFELVDIAEAIVSLNSAGLSPEQRLLAIRYVTARFAEDHWAPKPGEDMNASFNAMLSDTLVRAESLTETAARGAFEFAYQSVVDLKTGAHRHFEALARFNGGVDTGEAVRFAEALGVSDIFDLAVIAKVIREVELNQDARIAINMSGRSLGEASIFGMIAGLLARKRALAPRILIEITETAEIADLETANSAIQTLRQIGYRVGLDDFGTGAASLRYLHALGVDFVKVDGTLVKKIGESSRDDAFLVSIVKLCRELGASTIAECIETEAHLGLARKMGFDMGQGWFIAKPQPHIEPAAKNSQQPKRERAKQASSPV